jgi:hypothetical protein
VSQYTKKGREAEPVDQDSTADHPCRRCGRLPRTDDNDADFMGFFWSITRTDETPSGMDLTCLCPECDELEKAVAR